VGELKLLMGQCTVISPVLVVLKVYSLKRKLITVFVKSMVYLLGINQSIVFK
jgi:hypothetical protein